MSIFNSRSNTKLYFSTLLLSKNKQPFVVSSIWKAYSQAAIVTSEISTFLYLP